jgi:hypothetical protein
MHRPAAAPDPAKLREAVLDVFVYAPIGFLFDARDLVPKLAERGKGQVALARLFGRYAWQRGHAEADRVLKGRVPTPSPTAPPAAAASPATPPAPAPATTARRAKAAGKKKAATRATPDHAIPGYDSLSASQVVPRLDALRPAELEAVRVYEIAHRGRRTILNRIAQLQA